MDTNKTPDKNQSYGNQDEKEKSRKLSEAEQKRLQKFEALSQTMISQGYKRVDLTISIIMANVFAVLLLIPLFAAGLGLFFLKNRFTTDLFHPVSFFLLLLGLIVLTVVHELIHGISWAIFAEHHFKDIEFGFMKQYLTPYCTCTVPLTKGQYIFGALMPLLILGIIPMIAGILTGSFSVLLMGIIMADSAAGDIMIVWNMLRYKTQASETVYIDHPTQAGIVVFEK